MEILHVRDAVSLWCDPEHAPQKEIHDHSSLCDAAPTIYDEVPVPVVAYVSSRYQELEPILAKRLLNSSHTNQ